MKPNKIVDSIFLIVLMLLISLTIYQHFAIGNLLSLNNYFAYGLFSIVVVGRALKLNIPSYSVFLLLALSTLNIISFTVEIFELRIGVEVGIHYNSLSINPISFTLVLIYSIINRRYISFFISRMIKGSPEEQNAEREKIIRFYYEKFESIGGDELDVILNNYAEYPEEAQIALNRLKKR